MGRRLWQIALLVVYASALSWGKSIPTLAGPYIGYAEHIVDCEDVPPAKYPNFFQARFSHFNPARPSDPQGMQGNYTVHRLVDDTYWVHAELDSFSNNQWKKNAFHFKFPSHACTTLKENIPDYYRILTEDGPRHDPRSCYFSQGVHKFNGTVKWVLPHFPLLYYGRYRLNFKFGSRGDTNPMYSCCTIVRIIPRSV